MTTEQQLVYLEARISTVSSNLGALIEKLAGNVQAFEEASKRALEFNDIASKILAEAENSKT